MEDFDDKSHYGPQRVKTLKLADLVLYSRTIGNMKKKLTSVKFTHKTHIYVRYADNNSEPACMLQ